MFRKAQSFVRYFSFSYSTWRSLRTGCQARVVSLHAYADDTQLYLHFCRNEIASSVDQLERCVLDIGHWMSANRLKLNADKTELLFASSSHSCATPSGRYPVLQLGADSPILLLRAAMFVCSVSTSLPIRVWITTSPVSARGAATDFVNCVVSGGRWTPTR